MAESLIPLSVAAIVFVASHFLLSATPVRNRLTGWMGEMPFRVAYSVVAIGTFIWLNLAYTRAPLIELWPRADWAFYVALAVMPVAVILSVCGVLTPNPTSVTGARVLESDDPAPGIFRVTRHPVMWAITLWAAVHVLNTADAASTIFFGSLCFLALAGVAHLDKRRGRDGDEAWQRLMERTSFIPFVAAARGRAKISLAEIGWWRIVFGALAFVVLWLGHEWGSGIVVTPW